MDNSTNQFQLPFQPIYSFASIIKELENSNDKMVDIRTFLTSLHVNVEQLINGVDSIDKFEALLKDVSPLLEQIIPSAMTKNNLKALCFPMIEKYIYPTESLHQIIDGHHVVIKTKYQDLNAYDYYKLACCFILSRYYGINLESNQTNTIEVDQGLGYSSFYTVHYDIDYFDVYPIDPSYELTKDQIDDLLNNYENTSLWYEYMPPNSWVAKGIAIASLFDNTTEIALSNLKTNLISINEILDNINDEAVKSLKSIFRISDLIIGFSSLNDENNTIEGLQNKSIKESLILNHGKTMKRDDLFCTNFIDQIVSSNYYVISNIEKHKERFSSDIMIDNLLAQGIKSIILYPLRKGDENLGILEIASSIPGAFNRINASLLKDLLPLIEDSIHRYSIEFMHQVNSFIQTEYTSLHPSVEWKFKNKAIEIILNPDSAEKKSEISFNDVYPFYGELDVRSSSMLRNQCMKMDYQNQMNFLIKVCEEMYRRSGKTKFLEDIEQLNKFLSRIDQVEKIYFEREIFEFISLNIHPEIPNYTLENEESIIADYLGKLDAYTGLFYVERKKFDESIQILNKTISTGLDQYQVEAQTIIPHYYERFKTDGIDFNLYVGRSISPKYTFDYSIVRQLRFWQIKTMILLEQSYHAIKTTLPMPLEIASLILSSNLTLDITFKLDEKRFDVDGYNNAKYEIIKKRINKAYVKGSNERINIPGHICVIYTEDILREEYTYCINQLIAQGFLHHTIEYLEVEELQSLGGLRAIRVPIVYH